LRLVCFLVFKLSRYTDWYEDVWGIPAHQSIESYLDKIIFMSESWFETFHFSLTHFEKYLDKNEWIWKKMTRKHNFIFYVLSYRNHAGPFERFTIFSFNVRYWIEKL
jgi:hypothetical protein